VNTSIGLGSNVIVNGDFETGTLTPWTITPLSSSPTPIVDNTIAHTGTYSVLLGDPTIDDGSFESTGDSAIEQVVSVPAGSSTLSFWVKRFTSDTITFDQQKMLILDAAGTTVLATPMNICTTDAGWVNITVPMTAYAGQTVTLRWLVHSDGATDVTNMNVDDVTLSPSVAGFDLVVNTAGITTFGGAVGGVTALGSVTTDSPGSTAINAGTIRTNGVQAYGDAVTLGAGTTLTSLNLGNVSFGSTINGAQTLAVNTGGTTTFNGAVGGVTALTSVTTDSQDLRPLALDPSGPTAPSLTAKPLRWVRVRRLPV